MLAARERFLSLGALDEPPCGSGDCSQTGTALQRIGRVVRAHRVGAAVGVVVQDERATFRAVCANDRIRCGLAMGLRESGSAIRPPVTHSTLGSVRTCARGSN
jgi:hypothetical protein